VSEITPHRAPLLRAAVAAVAAIDLLSFVYFLRMARGAAGEAAIGTFADLLSRTPIAFAVAAAGVVAAISFARVPGRIAAGAIALGALALLSTAHAQLFGSPWRHLYYSGLCLAGWLAGLLAARRHAPGDESYARTGALALLGAAYLNAGISKLVFGGGDWATSVPIQAAIIGQDGLVSGGLLHAYRILVVETPSLAAALSVATVVFELAGPFMIAGRRLQLLVAGGLIAMHFNILLLTGEILYWEAMLFLGLFALAPDDTAAGAKTGPASRPFAGALFAPAAAVLVVLSALGISHQAARYRQLNHRSDSTDPALATPSQSLRAVGPFAIGAAMGDDWSIQRLEITERGFTITLRGTPGRARFELTCAPSEHASPFDLGAAHIFYSNDVPFAALTGAGNALRDVVRGAAADQDICAALEAWRAAADS